MAFKGLFSHGVFMIGFKGRHKGEKGKDEREVSHLDRLQKDTESVFISDTQT